MSGKSSGDAMEPREADILFNELLASLRAAAPWAAEQVDATVRSGRPVAKQVRQSKRGGPETVSIVVAPIKLGDNQFAATEELTAHQRAMVALEAVEALLLDPPAIDKELRATLSKVNVTEVTFAEPAGRDVSPPEPIH